MKKHFTQPQRHLRNILRQLQLDAGSEQAARYRQLLDTCLPAMWRDRVLLGSVEGLRWQLWVANGSDGTRLRFLLSEIQNVLAQKLPHPPQLSTSYADSGLIAHLPIEDGSEEGADENSACGRIKNIADADQR